MIKKFLKHNSINYSDLEYSGENEIDQDFSHKEKWGKLGVKALEEVCGYHNLSCNFRHNRSGSIDRGYVTGFIKSNDYYGERFVYVSINDGMQDILFRIAQSTSDYSGGMNHTSPISKEGFEDLENFIVKYLVKLN